MTDRELLELAAKASGFEYKKDGCIVIKDFPLNWNPLTDDGDALRLAVKLGMQIDTREPATRVYGAPSGAVDEHNFADPYAATRRAIVRAAAEIGRSMK